MSRNNVNESRERFLDLLQHTIFSFRYGIVLYELVGEEQPVHIMCVVEGSCYLKCYKWEYIDGKYHYLFVSEKVAYEDLLKEIDLNLIESFSRSSNKDDVYSGIGDFDYYRNQLQYDGYYLGLTIRENVWDIWDCLEDAFKKSLSEGKVAVFRAIQICDFGIQCADDKSLMIKDFHRLDYLWKEINECLETDWRYYDSHYSPVLYNYMDRFDVLCPETEPDDYMILLENWSGKPEIRCLDDDSIWIIPHNLYRKCQIDVSYAHLLTKTTPGAYSFIKEDNRFPEYGDVGYNLIEFCIMYKFMGDKLTDDVVMYMFMSLCSELFKKNGRYIWFSKDIKEFHRLSDMLNEYDGLSIVEYSNSLVYIFTNQINNISK